MNTPRRILVGLARHRAGLALALLVTACRLAQAQPLGLMQAFEAALQHDPTFHAAMAERDAGREHTTLGRAQLLPSISAQYGTSQNRTHVSSESGPAEQRSYRSTNTSVQLRQPLYHPEGRAAWQQGQALTAASDARFEARRQDLIVRLFEAFSGVLQTQEQVTLAQAQLTALTEQKRANLQLLAKGEGTRTEVLETDAKHQMAEAQRIEAQDRLNHARNQLAAMIGQPVQALTPLAEGFSTDPAAGAGLAQWRETALQDNGVLQSLRWQVQAASEEVRRARGGHQPRLDLLASVGRSESDTVSSYRQTYRTQSLGVQLHVPLYDGGAVSAQTRQALARQAQAEAELDSRTEEVLVELQRQYQLQQSTGLRVAALDKAAASGRLLIEATQKSVAGGVRTNLDVLNARERLTQAESDLAVARHAHLLAGLRLRLAAGVLSEKDLRELARRFQSQP